MKLAEALIFRATLQKRIIEVKDRVMRFAITQEDIEPPEDVENLLSQLAEMYNQLEILIANINRTNSEADIRPGFSLTDALAMRDILGLRHAHYRDIALAGVVGARIGRKFEIMGGRTYWMICYKWL